MDGVLNCRKQAGPTSHDVVDRVRRVFGQKKVGHAGTLDPMATGVLVICLGKATRVLEYLDLEPKEYRARLMLGMATDSEDSSGNVVGEADASCVTLESLTLAASGFAGEIDQTPPMVSAIQHQGRRLYDLAPKGETVERAPRRVTIHSIRVVDFTPGERAEAEIEVACSGGTYIRTICADIGEKLGCGAHMTALERTGVGPFGVEDALTVEQLEEAGSAGRLAETVMSIDAALAHVPEALVTAEDAVRAIHGLTVAARTDAADGATVRIVGPDGALIAVGTACRADDGVFAKPKKVLVDECCLRAG